MTRKIGSIGDVNPIEYGGGYVLEDPDLDTPWVEYYYGLDSEDGIPWDLDLDDPEQTDAIKVLVYRVDLESSTGAFVNWHSWIKWREINASCGRTGDGAPLTPEDTAQDRALLAQDVAGHWGWQSLDDSPAEITLTELIARWADY